MRPPKRLEHLSFLDRITRGEHWWWRGGKNSRGVPQVTFRGRRVTVARAVYATFVGPVPADKVVVTTCLVTRCLRPEHLALADPDAAGERCARGHVIAEVGRNDDRACRACRAEDYLERKRLGRKLGSEA